jgi:hypothetical protein
MKRTLPKRCLCVAMAASVAFVAAGRVSADEPKQDQKQAQAPAPQEKAPQVPTKEELEKRFSEMLSGVTLKGRFTSDRNDTAPSHEDQYDIQSVTKVLGDYWLFQVRIKYGNRDRTLPLPLRVVWAGDTPVITLDNMTVPGFGAFTARVMIFEGRYTGIWDGAGHGGVMVGTITKQAAPAAAPAPAPAASGSAEGSKPEQK